MIRLERPAALVGGAALLGALFWLSAAWASAPPGTQAMEIDVHGLSIGRYDGRSPYHPAPLSQRIVTDARRDAGGTSPIPPALPGPAAPATAPPPPPAAAPASPTSPALPVPGPTVPPLLPTPSVPPLPPTPTVPPLPPIPRI